MEKFIDVNNIHFQYDEKPVIDGLSFSVNKGEYVAIVGKNGCGKSTLAKLIAGLERVKDGQITIDGLTICDDNIQAIRKKIGYIFQNPDNQFVGVTVRDDIAFGLENACIERSKMLSLIDEFSKKTNVYHLLDSSPSEISGGEKQRVALAGVLALAPDVIILDEATSMLDPKGVKEVNDCIASLKGEKTIFSITHNLDEIIIADKVLVIKNGKALAFDTPMEILKGDAIIEAGLDLPLDIALLREVRKLNNKELEDELWKLIFKK